MPLNSSTCVPAWKRHLRPPVLVREISPVQQLVKCEVCHTQWLQEPPALLVNPLTPTPVAPLSSLPSAGGSTGSEGGGAPSDSGDTPPPSSEVPPSILSTAPTLPTL